MGKSSIGGKYEHVRRVIEAGPYRNFVEYPDPICTPTQPWETYGAQEDPRIITVGDVRYMFNCSQAEEEEVSTPFGDLVLDIGLRTQSISDPPQTWTPYAGNPIVSHMASGWAFPFIATPNVVPMQDGSYRMYVHGFGLLNGVWTDRGGVLFCTADNFPVGPWVHYGGNPILDVGGPGEWDSVYTQLQIVIPPWTRPGDPCASVSSDGLWHLLYGGMGGGGVWAGGHVVSGDGLVWVKDPLNPVLRPSSGAGWDSQSVLPVGQSIQINGVHHILYQAQAAPGLWSLGVAGTVDFREFVRSPFNPLLGPARENPGVSFNPTAGTLDLFPCCQTGPASSLYVLRTARSTFTPFTP